MITLFRLSCLHLCIHVRYVCFTTNLSLLSKEKTLNQIHFSTIFLSLLMLGLLIELENNQILLFVVLMNPNFGRLSDLLLKFSKIVSRSIFTTLSFYMFSIAVIPVTCILSLFVFQIWKFSFEKQSTLLGALFTHFVVKRHSVEPWTPSHRVDLIEARNSIFNYDLISVCETNLDDTMELPETLLKDYTFVPANHP